MFAGGSAAGVAAGWLATFPEVTDSLPLGLDPDTGVLTMRHPIAVFLPPWALHPPRLRPPTSRLVFNQARKSIKARRPTAGPSRSGQACC